MAKGIVKPGPNLNIPLTDEEMLFCEAFAELDDPDQGEEAVLQVWPEYSHRAARAALRRLLRKPEIKEYIAVVKRRHEDPAVLAESALAPLPEPAEDARLSDIQRLEHMAMSCLGALFRFSTLDVSGCYDAQNKLIPIHKWPEAVRLSVQHIHNVRDKHGRYGIRSFTIPCRRQSAKAYLEMRSKLLGELVSQPGAGVPVDPEASAEDQPETEAQVDPAILTYIKKLEQGIQEETEYRDGQAPNGKSNGSGRQH